MQTAHTQRHASIRHTGLLGVVSGLLVSSLGSCSDHVLEPSAGERVVASQQALIGDNFALRFHGNGVNDIDRVKIRVDDPSTSTPGPPVDVGATDFTIEFWMKAVPGENAAGAIACGANVNWINGNIVVDRDRYDQGRKFGISLGGGRLAFGTTGASGSHRTICGTTRIDDGQWHHLAFTRERSSGAMRIFVDGTLDASASSGPGGDVSYPDAGVPGNYCGGACTNSDPFMVIGAEKHDSHPIRYPAFRGWIDELRVSTVLRYSTSFDRPTRAFTTDAQTAALYHFDEGSGDVITDASSGGSSTGIRKFGGSPAGPLWVASDAPTGPAGGNRPPAAAIAAPGQDVTTTVGQEIVFHGTASDLDGTIASHSWSFGDGTTASVEDPGARTYATEGSYQVTYHVTDDAGASSAVATRTVTVVANQAPTATIDSPQQNVTITRGAAVTFMATANDPDGNVDSHHWTFGDGVTAAVEDPGVHTYPEEGTFTVTYQATDELGMTSPIATRTVTVVTASANNALRFFGNGTNDIDRVKIRVDDPATSSPGPPVDVGATDFTLEFWLKANPGDNAAGAVTCGANINWINGNIVIDRDRYNQNRKYGISLGAGRVAFGVSGSNGSHRTICGSTRVDDGQWHHVAVTRQRSTGAMRLFVDGALDASATNGPTGDISYPDAGVPGNHCGGPCTNSDPFIVIGAEKHDVHPVQYPAFRGWIDELRISTVLRYDGSFNRPTSAFTTDAGTAGLYHFDEGGGDVITDVSGASGGPSHGTRRFGGSPAGPQWVISDVPIASR